MNVSVQAEWMDKYMSLVKKHGSSEETKALMSSEMREKEKALNRLHEYGILSVLPPVYICV